MKSYNKQLKGPHEDEVEELMKISLDLDDTVNYWYKVYLEKFGNPSSDSEVTQNVMRILRTDKDFWMNLPIKHYPNFEVHCYTTARVIPKDWIKQYLVKNNLPKAPIYQVFGVHLSKVPQLKRSGCDVHIDDSIANFIECNLAGIPTLLMDSDNNQDWGPIGRVYSLDSEEIEEVYWLFMNTVFPYFRELL